MKIIFAGGGTAGHILPAIVLAEEIKSKSKEVLFIVSNKGIEKRLLEKRNYPFYEQILKGFKRENLVVKIFSIMLLMREIIKIFFKINRRDKIFLLGGYACLATGISAIIKRADIYIYEQNAVMGLANRLLAPFAKKVLLAFKDTMGARGNLKVVGYPVRKQFLQIAIKDSLGKNILVVGGSQGSLFINNLIVSTAYILLDRGFNIVQQTGEKLFEKVVEKYKEQGLYRSNALNLYSFIDDIAPFYEWADIIISRAGAGSVFESLHANRPTIFIPLSTAADNHQLFNALIASRFGFGIVLEEKKADTTSLITCIDQIYENYASIKNKLKTLNYKDTINEILKEVGIE